MKIKMLKNCPGSVDGISSTMYMEGKEYDSGELGEDLVKVFLDNKFAEEVKEKIQSKNVPSSPENKAVNPDSNKNSGVEEETVSQEEIEDILKKGNIGQIPKGEKFLKDRK